METEMPADITNADLVTIEALDELEANLVAEFDALHDAGSNDLATMTAIADSLDAIRNERERRDNEEAQTAAEREAIAQRIHGAPADETEDEADPADAADAAADDAPADDAAPAEAPAAQPEPVTASAPRPPVAPARRPVSAAGVARNSTRPAVPSATGQIAITAAADISGHSAGARINTLDVARAFHSKARSLSNHSAQVPVATVEIPIAPNRMITERMELTAALEVIDAATNVDSAQSLVASGGWCAPSQVMYDLFSIDSADGLFDLPQVGIARGGVVVPNFYGYNTAAGALWTWTNQNDVDADHLGRIVNKALTTNVARLTTDHPHGLVIGDVVIVTGVDSVFNGSYTVASVPTTTTFTYAKTNANVTSAAASGYYNDSTGELTKPCVKIDCPTFMEYVLEAEGLCVTHGNLSDRAYPEFTRKFVNLVMNLHLHRMSSAMLNKVIATATAVTVTTTTTDTAGDVLSAIELQAQDFRNQYLMSLNSVLEVVMPTWIKGAIRTTLAMRAGVPIEGAMNVTDAQIEAWFVARGIRPQYVQGYQGIYQATPTLAWPASFKFLMYPAGGYFKGDGGTIDLGVVRDSLLNQTNDFTAAWSEQFYLVGQRGPNAREVTVAISTNGVTACCP